MQLAFISFLCAQEEGLRMRRTTTSESNTSSRNLAAQYISSNQQLSPAFQLQQPVVVASLVIILALGLILGKIIFWTDRLRNSAKKCWKMFFPNNSLSSPPPSS